MPYQAVILTVSDSCAAGTRTDTSGPAIRSMLEKAGFAVQAMQTDLRSHRPCLRYAAGRSCRHDRRHRPFPA